jgi:hypothetical protein
MILEKIELEEEEAQTVKWFVGFGRNLFVFLKARHFWASVSTCCRK